MSTIDRFRVILLRRLVPSSSSRRRGRPACWCCGDMLHCRCSCRASCTAAELLPPNLVLDEPLPVQQPGMGSASSAPEA